MKTCKICGKPFESKVRNKITCSDECHKANCRLLWKDWYYKNHEKTLEYFREKPYQYKPQVKCKICGNIIEKKEFVGKQRSTIQMHEECVFNDCLNTLKGGNKLSSIQAQRLAARGYTISEFREEYL